MIDRAALALWITVCLYGLSAGILAYWLLGFLQDGLTWLHRRKHPAAWVIAQAEGERTDAARVTLDDLLGLKAVPWPTIYALSGLAAIAIYLATRQILALSLGIFPLATKLWLTNLRKRQLAADIWHFLMDLRIRRTLRGSLLLALQDVAKADNTQIARVVSGYLEGGFRGSGLELLARLAEDTQAPFLADLVARTQAAQDGALRLDEALKQAMGRVQAEMETGVREQLQQIPTRLILLVFPVLLGPTLVVLFYPLVARILANLSGISGF